MEEAVGWLAGSLQYRTKTTSIPTVTLKLFHIYAVMSSLIYHL